MLFVYFSITMILHYFGQINWFHFQMVSGGISQGFDYLLKHKKQLIGSESLQDPIISF